MIRPQRAHESRFNVRIVTRVLLFFAICAILFSGLRILFRGDKDYIKKEVVNAEQSDPVPTIEELSRDIIARETSVSGLSGYMVTGLAQTKQSFFDYEATIVASLPPIDASQERYEAWLIQPGVSNYFSLGSFFARNDGWYGLTYKERLIHIPEYPELYQRLLITRETLNDDNVPSRIWVAEGFFNL